MLLKSKKFRIGKKSHEVLLEKHEGTYVVKCDDDVVYKSANVLFAAQRFNAI